MDSEDPTSSDPATDTLLPAITVSNADTCPPKLVSARTDSCSSLNTSPDMDIVPPMLEEIATDNPPSVIISVETVSDDPSEAAAATVSMSSSVAAP